MTARRMLSSRARFTLVGSRHLSSQVFGSKIISQARCTSPKSNGANPTIAPARPGHFARARPVPGHFARTGPGLVHFARDARVLGLFSRPLLGNFSLHAHAGCVGAFAGTGPVLGHFARPVL